MPSDDALPLRRRRLEEAPRLGVTPVLQRNARSVLNNGPQRKDGQKKAVKDGQKKAVACTRPMKWSSSEPALRGQPLHSFAATLCASDWLCAAYQFIVNIRRFGPPPKDACLQRWSKRTRLQDHSHAR